MRVGDVLFRTELMAVAAAARRRVIVAWHRMTPPTPDAEALPEAPKNSYLMYICCLYLVYTTCDLLARHRRPSRRPVLVLVID